MRRPQSPPRRRGEPGGGSAPPPGGSAAPTAGCWPVPGHPGALRCSGTGAEGRAPARQQVLRAQLGGRHAPGSGRRPRDPGTVLPGGAPRSSRSPRQPGRAGGWGWPGVSHSAQEGAAWQDGRCLLLSESPNRFCLGVAQLTSPRQVSPRSAPPSSRSPCLPLGDSSHTAPCDSPCRFLCSSGSGARRHLRAPPPLQCSVLRSQVLSSLSGLGRRRWSSLALGPSQATRQQQPPPSFPLVTSGACWEDFSICLSFPAVRPSTSIQSLPLQPSVSRRGLTNLTIRSYPAQLEGHCGSTVATHSCPTWSPKLLSSFSKTLPSFVCCE